LASGEYLVNLSAHCIPTNSEWLANLLRPLQSDDTIAATYGNQIPIKGLNPFEERLTIAAFRPDREGNVKAIFSNSNCAVRKRVWEKYPFDEKASFAEDFLWSQLLPIDYRIKYVAVAAVYHSHPLTFAYWSKRYYDNGLMIQYLSQVYGFNYPWKSKTTYPYAFLQKLYERVPFLKSIHNYLVELYDVVTFMLRHKYFLSILIFPIFFLVKQYYFHKGFREGKRLYAFHNKVEK
jgi:hypothetical protein